MKAAGSEPVVVVTWAKKDHPEDTKKLADSIISAANENGAAALPVGLAFAEAHAGRPDINFYAPDKRHPSPRVPISMAPWLTASSSTGHLKA